jgi:hypothetical protein
MHLPPRLIALALLFAGLAPSALWAQSLADIARREEERRKSVKEATKTYTNKDLKPVVVYADSAPADAPPAGGTVTPAAEKSAPDKKEAAAEPVVKDQKYWSGRMRDLQSQLDRDQTYVDALQSRVNALTADFVNRDDPAQRAVISADRQKALAELDRVTQAIRDDKKNLSDLEEEARRDGVPPGWLR